VGRSIALGAADVAAITAGSDFDRATLGGLNLSGLGNTLFVNVGPSSNVLTLQGNWIYLGQYTASGGTFSVYQQNDSVVLLNGGTIGFNVSNTQSTMALSWSDVVFESAPANSADKVRHSDGNTANAALADSIRSSDFGDLADSMLLECLSQRSLLQLHGYRSEEWL
jgi:hypothetical protein